MWAGSCRKHPDALPFQPVAEAKLLGAASAGQRKEPGEAGLALRGAGAWGGPPGAGHGPKAPYAPGLACILRALLWLINCPDWSPAPLLPGGRCVAVRGIITLTTSSSSPFVSSGSSSCRSHEIARRISGPMSCSVLNPA